MEQLDFLEVYTFLTGLGFEWDGKRLAWDYPGISFRWSFGYHLNCERSQYLIVHFWHRGGLSYGYTSAWSMEQVKSNLRVHTEDYEEADPYLQLFL